MDAAAATGADPTIKRVTITAAAAAGAGTSGLSPPPEEDAGIAAPATGGRRRTQRKSRKLDLSSVVVTKSEEGATVGGGSTSPGTMVQLAASRVPGSNSSHAVGASSGLTAAGAIVGRTAPAAANDPEALSGAAAKVGGAPPNQKVVLAKPRNKTAKVMLAAPKPGKKPGTPAGAAKHHRKTAKKVHVSLKGLSSKLRRAKTIRKKATGHTLEQVKKELLAAGLIKADSKAPEGILRQMYADFMTLKKKAL